MRKVICIMSRVDDTVIGVDNDLVVSSPIDMAHFKKTTMGSFLVMGRNTCESLPFKLPNRHSHVITSNPTYESDKADSSGSLNMDYIREMADEYYGDKDHPIYVIGGASLIRSMYSEIDEVIETYFYSIVCTQKTGKVTRMDRFKVKQVLSMERFLDRNAKFVPTRSLIVGGVSGRIMHFTIK